jgi:hypothetical protein
LEDIPLALLKVNAEHRRLHEAIDTTANPNVIYCASYQDGLAHSFARMLARMRTGQYSHKCDVVQQLEKYQSIRSENLRAGRYVDVAYIEGYMNGLVYLLASDEGRSHLPFYFLYGCSDQPSTFNRYRRALRMSAGQHKRATAEAARIVRKKLGPGDELHHTPFLTWKAEG